MEGATAGTGLHDRTSGLDYFSIMYDFDPNYSTSKAPAQPFRVL